jgi:hypothetical protein
MRARPMLTEGLDLSVIGALVFVAAQSALIVGLLLGRRKRLRLLADLFAIVRMRRDADRALEASERSRMEALELRSAIVGSLYGPLVALDRSGVIIGVNEGWTAR